MSPRTGYINKPDWVVVLYITYKRIQTIKMFLHFRSIEFLTLTHTNTTKKITKYLSLNSHYYPFYTVSVVFPPILSQTLKHRTITRLISLLINEF